MTRLIIRKRFYASHAVRLKDGPEPRHGHDWNLVVELSAEENVDSSEVELAIDQIIQPLENSDLNEIGELKPFGATAESLARHLHGECARALSSKLLHVDAVRLEEEAGCWASYSER